MSPPSVATEAPRQDVATLRPVVLDLLLADRPRATAAAERLSAGGAWPAAAALCRGWKALPLLRARLNELGISLPEPARTAFLDENRAAFLHSATCLRQGAEAVASLRAAGIDAVAFKGVAAIARHSGPQERTITDADLLVREEDLEAAVAALGGRGLRHQAGGDLAGYLHFVRNSPGFAGNEALSLFGADGFEIDLHWRIGRGSLERVLDRAVVTEVYGRPVPVPDDVHGFLLSARHALRNNLDPDVSVRDLVDARAWLECVHGQDRLAALAREARAWALAVPAMGMVEILRRFRDDETLVEAAAALTDSLAPSARAEAAALADIYFLQVRRGPLEADLLLLHPTSLRKILSGWGRAPGRYRETMKTFEVRAHGAPMSLSGRLARLVRSAVRLPWACWRLLPALARAQRLSSR